MDGRCKVLDAWLCCTATSHCTFFHESPCLLKKSQLPASIVHVTDLPGKKKTVQVLLAHVAHQTGAVHLTCSWLSSCNAVSDSQKLAVLQHSNYQLILLD